MLPHSYTVDSLSRSQDLASHILSASRPPEISAACSSVESFLLSHTPDQSRHFFSITFPTLICKLFGFGDATVSAPSPPPPNGWIDAVSASNDLDLAAKVFSLLSPNGTLMTSISSVDKSSLVKYVFPIERLPDWTRFMLSSEKDCRVLSDLCPMFRGKIQEDLVKGASYEVRLNVFEYYMFWFAYYPVCKGNGENAVTVSMKKTNKFRLEKWASSIRGFPGSSRRDPEQKVECNLYVRLLYAYLKAFVPVFDLNAHQPYRISLLHYGNACDGSVMTRAESLVNVFVHYWLVDNDFSPLSVSTAKSFGVASSLRAATEKSPPTSGLEEVVKLFVKYLNLSWATSGYGHEKHLEYGESPRWKTPSSGSSVNVQNLSVRPLGSWNTYIQRPFYRYILRTFLFCPMASSIKNASQVFSVWVTYLEPWVINLDDFSDLDAISNGSTKVVKKDQNSESQTGGYTQWWQSYVISNYLYYTSLVMHFIGFAHKFLHTDPETITQMVLKVMSILTSSTELADLIKNVDSAFHSRQTPSAKSTLPNLSRFVPSIREQLKDWEDGLCESNADGSFLHENWNKDLQLFRDGEDGGQQLLQLFILRAEAELHAVSGNNVEQVVECIDTLKSKVSNLFGGHVIKPISFSLEPEVPQKTREALFKPRRGGTHGKGCKEDWMRRPVSEDEVGWLARLLVHISVWLNQRLGLDQAGEEESRKGEEEVEYVEIREEEVRGGVAEMMRRHGVHVNLRVLASKKVMMLFFLYILFYVIKKLVRMLW